METGDRVPAVDSHASRGQGVFCRPLIVGCPFSREKEVKINVVRKVPWIQILFYGRFLSRCFSHIFPICNSQHCGVSIIIDHLHIRKLGERALFWLSVSSYRCLCLTCRSSYSSQDIVLLSPRMWSMALGRAISCDSAQSLKIVLPALALKSISFVSK